MNRLARVLTATTAILVASCGSSSSSTPFGSSNSAPGTTQFAVIGDFGTGNGDARAVASAIEAWDERHPLDALVTTGDNVYEHGAPSEFWKWSGPYGWVQADGVPVLASLGNHDVETDGGTPVAQLLEMPGAWYAERIGPVAFVVLDANRPTDPEQLAFAEQALADAATAPWSVVVFHQPAYSCAHHGSTPDVLQAFAPLFGPRGVDLVLNGHDHDYQRFGPIDGVTYVVTGGGGGSLYDMRDCPEGTPGPMASAVAFHFVTIEATAETLIVAARAPDGRTLDRFTLAR